MNSSSIITLGILLVILVSGTVYSYNWKSLDVSNITQINYKAKDIKLVLENGEFIKTCYGIYMGGNATRTYNLTLEERKAYYMGKIDTTIRFPLNISLPKECGNDNFIRTKLYNSYKDFPLRDDCINPNKCFIKYNDGDFTQTKLEGYK